MKPVSVTALTLVGLASVAVAAPPEGRPSEKTQTAVRALKEDLSAFMVTIYSWPPIDRSGTLESVTFAVDPKKVAAREKRVFPITEKQATALIDYLAAEGMFDRTYIPPPGFPAPGWFVVVTGGKPSEGKMFGVSGQWWFSPETRTRDVVVIQHLTKPLDGDAKAALEAFRKEEKPKK